MFLILKYQNAFHTSQPHVAVSFNPRCYNYIGRNYYNVLL